MFHPCRVLEFSPSTHVRWLTLPETPAPEGLDASGLHGHLHWRTHLPSTKTVSHILSSTGLEQADRRGRSAVPQGLEEIGCSQYRGMLGAGKSSSLGLINACYVHVPSDINMRHYLHKHVWLYILTGLKGVMMLTPFSFGLHTVIHCTMTTWWIQTTVLVLVSAIEEDRQNLKAMLYCTHPYLGVWWRLRDHVGICTYSEIARNGKFLEDPLLFCIFHGKTRWQGGQDSVTGHRAAC